MTKKTNKKGGTIFINETYTPQEAFNKFLNSSHIHFFSSGGYGVILKATYFENPETSPYYSFNSDQIASPTTTLILKLIILNDNISPQNKSTGNLEWTFGPSNLAYANYTDFKREIQMQNKVVVDTIEYLEPISPVIVYSDIYEGYEETTTLLKVIKNRSIHHLRTQELLKTIYNQINIEQIFKNRETKEYITSKSSIGLIAMELISSDFNMLRNIFHDVFGKKILRDEIIKDYEKKIKGIPVNDLYKNDDMRTLIDRVYYISTQEKLELYKNMARLSIIEIAEKSGISQADFHFGNILVDPNYKGYYEDTLIKPPTSSPKPESVSSYHSMSSLSTVNSDNEDEKSESNSIKRPLSKTDFMDLDDDVRQNKKMYDYNVGDDFDVSVMDPNDKQYGGNDEYINSGKTIIIDYGISSIIPPDVMITIKELYNNIYENINDTDTREKIDKITNMIYDLLSKIYSIKRADGTSLNEFPQWYSWLAGGYLSGGVEKDILLSGIHITYQDFKMFKSLINSRKNAINNLIEKFNNLEKTPFKLPLKKEEILKRIYSNDQTGGNKKNTLDTYVENAFQTIGYGMYSMIALEKKINNARSSLNNKMVKTPTFLQPSISVGVGGKKIKKKNNKTKHNKNKKHKNHKKTRRT